MFDVFPAQAGMNRSEGIWHGIRSSTSVPRTGGDEPVTKEDVAAEIKCSPHRRG